MARVQKKRKSCIANGKHPGGRPLEYDAKRFPTIAWALAVRGATNVEIADALGIAERTLYAWKKKYPEFLQSIKDGNGSADAQVTKSFFASCFDRQVKETRRIIKPNTDGTPQIVSVEETTRIIPANVVAQQVWLYNRCPESWRRNPDAEREDKGRDPFSIYLDGLRDNADEQSDRTDIVSEAG